ncbi:MAG TPA: hypothetical protein VK642_02475 [Burkholderiales bacterium]|nr:hypothetical protein [Burkholderiales bacterium]
MHLFRKIIALALMSAAPFACAVDALPIFDAHVHYSQEAWERMPPKEAIALLRKAGVKRALVSSTNDDGNQKLFAEAPDLILPSLRTYRARGDISTWFHDKDVATYLQERLKKYRYAAIGEFHVFGADVDAPVARLAVQLAKQYKLFLHAHTDVEGVERIFKQDADARVLWAHSGFERPSIVREMLRKHKNLWCDLAFRNDHAAGGKLDADWRAAFIEFPDRFMVGTDTYTAERWHYVVEHANWSRGWLADLPRDVAERIAYRNGDAIFGNMMKP